MTDINHEEIAVGAEEIHQVWKDFERRLLTLVETMSHPKDRLVLEVGGSAEVPTVEFSIDGGQLAATIGDDSCREHIAGREAIVHRGIMLLRNIAGIPHPDLLTHRAEGPVAQMSPVLGLAWTGGQRPSPSVYIEPDRELLLDIIEEQLMEVYDVGRDTDDDLYLDHADHRVYVRVAPGASAIEIFSRVAHGARSRRQAAIEVGILNRTNPWVWWQIVGRDIFQTSTVESMPFVPHHLMTTMSVFLTALTATRDDLALRVGGEVA